MTLNQILNKKVKVKNFEFKVMDIIMLLIITILGMQLRYKLFPFEFLDYIQHLTRWWKQIIAAGRFGALKGQIGNYTQPYIFIMAIGTYLPWRDITYLKAVACVCDLLVAVFAGLCIYEITKNKTKSFIGYAIAFLSPTVIMNSAVWSQCDSIIMLFMILTIYGFLKNKPAFSCIMLGIAMAIKIQAIFIAPVLLILWMNKRLSFKHLLLIPLAYCACFLPTLFAGGNYFKALFYVVDQINTTSTHLAFNVANMWAPLAPYEENVELIGSAGTKLALIVTFAAAYFCIRKPIKLTNQLLMLMFLFFSILVPFILPYMHDRYYYYAEIIAIIYAMINHKYIYAVFGLIFVSAFSYFPFLFGVEPISFTYLAIIMLVILVKIAKDLYISLKANTIKE